MRAETLKNTLRALYSVRRTVCIEGAPGGGKTTIVAQVAKELAGGGGVRHVGSVEVFNECFGFVEKHMPTMLVEDFGIPIIGGDTMRYQLPDWFPAADREDIPEDGILLFDDRNQASADLQKVLANICQARTLHGVPMKKGWMVVSTGNRQEDRAGANRVLSHLRNRETVLTLDTMTDDWTKWAAKNGVRAEVIAFINFRPGLLHDFNPKQDVNPTPRSWAEGVSAVLGVVPSEAELECFKGAVGEGPATEFRAFLKIFRSLPDPVSVLANPDRFECPSDASTRYALCGAIADRAVQKNMDAVVKVCDKMPAEFAVLTMTLAVRRDDSLSETKAFIDWAQRTTILHS